MNWLQNPQAHYVLAAYAVATCGLLGLLMASFLATRRRQKEWRQMQAKRTRNS